MTNICIRHIIWLCIKLFFSSINGVLFIRIITSWAAMPVAWHYVMSSDWLAREWSECHHIWHPIMSCSSATLVVLDWIHDVHMYPLLFLSVAVFSRSTARASLTQLVIVVVVVLPVVVIYHRPPVAHLSRPELSRKHIDKQTSLVHLIRVISFCLGWIRERSERASASRSG